MKFSKILCLILIISGLSFSNQSFSTTPDLKPVYNLVKRTCGDKAAGKIAFRLDSTSSDAGAEYFSISSTADGRPMISGSTLSALTTGFNFYLNRFMNINIDWNNPHRSVSDFILPDTAITRKANVPLRYYLNYCTFSYSMSVWTWERWEQEIDWMALHGVNLPLQIVGFEWVWREMLIKDYGYTPEEADRYIAGPCFQAWFGMNNLQGWGGPNPEGWYIRQKELGSKILKRMKQLGITPVLPGYAGSVPDDFSKKTGIPSIAQGTWCGFKRPDMLNPLDTSFKEVAANYYRHLKEFAGDDIRYVSIDPFHEGAKTADIDVDAAYRSIYNSLESSLPGAKWVIQQWQWSKAQYKVLDNVPVGRLIVLDLFSDGRPNWNAYGNHPTIYCTIPNFGGRTGFSGRFNTIIDGFFTALSENPEICGIGAAPEAIEQTPVIYDMIFDLAWLDVKPSAEQWIKDYAKSRYGKESDKAQKAWELLRISALDNKSSIQGPHEALICARPSDNIRSVSAWGSGKLYYDPQLVVDAARLLLEADLDGENYLYDLTDLTRQALSDYGSTLVEKWNNARAENDTMRASSIASSIMELIKDIDTLNGTQKLLRLGRWTSMARDISKEIPGSDSTTADWLELNNARTLITTWGERHTSERSGLHDYSYREWQGMLSDFYLPRWQKYLENSGYDAFTDERERALDANLKYSPEPVGDSREIASKLLEKYFTY